MNTVVEHERALPVLEDVLRRRVCSICANRNPDGSCDLDARHECILFERLPSLVQTVARVRSEEIGHYVTAIRESICGECFHQRLDGSCRLREEQRCALDRHVVPIIWAVESGLAVSEESGGWRRAERRLTVLQM